MSIAKLKKITLAGPIVCKTEALKALQDVGCLHLIPLSPPPAEPEQSARRDAEGALKALRFLTGGAPPPRQVRRDQSFDAEALVRDALQLKQQIRDVGDRRDFLAHRINQIRPWGDLTFAPKSEMAGQYLWFYRLPVKHRQALETTDLPPWTIVTVEDGLIYLVVIAPDEPSPDLLPVPRTHVGALPLQELEHQLTEVEIELERLQAERVAMSRYATLLRNDLAAAFTAAELAFAKEQTLDDDALFTLQAWAPTDRLPEIAAVADHHVLAIVIEEPRWDETPPTLLERPPEEAAGVDLAMFYQTPHYRSWDPSLVVTISFAIFFAMIISDAGYGLVVLLGVLLFWSRLSGSSRARSWRRLGLINASATIGYGVLIGSFFGAPPPEGSFLAQLKLVSLDDFDSMMRISIIVGVVHIVIANLMNAWSKRGRPSAFAHLGWTSGVVGGLTYWLADGAGVGGVGLAMVGLGFALVLFFSSDRPIESWLDWLWRLLAGLQQLTSIMGAFGDVLSYMRLFALGLASASLALTFNGLAMNVAAAVPGVGVLGATLILVVGHVLNFALALLSGVVHGLRLNYIEFYKWGLPEEGVAFRAFARREAPE